MKSNSKQNGFSLVEVVVASAIILMVTTGIMTTYNLYLKAATGNTETIQAALLLEEGVEAVKLLRDSGWTANIASLSTTTSYYLSWDSANSLWTATTSVNIIDSQFTRTFTLQEAYRDASSNLVSSLGGGATVDSGTRELTVTIGWEDHGTPVSKTLSTYISNIFSN
jgi:prepilin-type N-terminal cleavage/methylation domain-containing protein